MSAMILGAHNRQGREATMLAEMSTWWATVLGNVLDAVIVAAVVGVCGGVAAWLTQTYRRLVSVDGGVAAINGSLAALNTSVTTLSGNVAALGTQMASVLKRLDDHDAKLNEHALWRARWEGRNDALQEHARNTGERPVDQ